MPLPPAAPLALTDADRKQLGALSRQRNIPQGILLRVNIVLGAADGQANHVLARDLSTTVTTLLLWRKRYEMEGLARLFEDRPRSGRPRQILESKEAAIVEATMKTIPKDANQWSVRSMATSQKVSEFGRNTNCSRIGSDFSTSATIPISLQRSETSWDFT